MILIILILITIRFPVKATETPRARGEVTGPTHSPSLVVGQDLNPAALVPESWI